MEKFILKSDVVLEKRLFRLEFDSYTRAAILKFSRPRASRTEIIEYWRV